MTDQENGDTLRGVAEIALYMGEDPRGISVQDIQESGFPHWLEGDTVYASKEKAAKFIEEKELEMRTPTPVARFLLEEGRALPKSELCQAFIDRFGWRKIARGEFFGAHQQAIRIATVEIHDAIEAIAPEGH